MGVFFRLLLGVWELKSRAKIGPFFKNEILLQALSDFFSSVYKGLRVVFALESRARESCFISPMDQ